MSDGKNDGGPAFPFEYEVGEGLGKALHTGMTLRQWYAGQALIGLLAHASGEDPHKAPEMAFALADALIEHEASHD